MRRSLLILAVLSLAVAAPVQAMQGLAIGGRAGTLGVGAEAAFLLNDWLALRGGAGLLGVDADLTSVSRLAENRTGTLALPKSIYTFGADINVGNFRIGGGMLYKERDPAYAIRLGDGAEIEIGDGTYTEPDVTTLTTTLVSEAWAPFVLIGFGQNTSRGLGLFLDVGVAFLDHPALEMSATGRRSVLTSRSFRDDLRAEQQSVREDAGDLVNYWPILNLGLRFAVGGRDRRSREWR
ncbi:MAG: hypothetical protein OXE96_01760 [Gemmatimonadetes bacterium]|nr:hypothetical protein [Gemmatimonadota bacterium]